MASHIQPKEFIQFREVKGFENKTLLVSFDVSNFFTFSFQTQTELLNIEYAQINYFTFNDIFYKQYDRLAMGSPLSPILVKMFTFSFEEELQGKTKL